MSLTALPPELILCIGSHLQPRALNVLVQTAKFFADLLTPQLYDAGLQINSDIEKRLKGRETRPDGVLYPGIWPVGMAQWSSPRVLDYFVRKHDYRWAAPTWSDDDQELVYLPLAHAAVIAGNIAMLNLIILATGNPDPRDNDGKTPLHFAALARNGEAVEYLLATGADILAEDNAGLSSVYMASRYSFTSTAVLRQLVEATGKAGGDPMKPIATGSAPLHAAGAGKNLEAAMYLIVEGANPLARTSDGDFPAAWAMTAGNNDELSMLLITRIVSAHGDLSLPGRRDNTLLHRAVVFSDDRVVQYLIENGADVSAVNDNGETPLDIALADRRTDEILDLLVTRNRDPQGQHNSKVQVLEFALNDGEWQRAHMLVRQYPAVWPETHINSRLWRIAAKAARIGHIVFRLLVWLFRTGSSALDLSGEGGWSALHYLCSAEAKESSSAVDMMKLLVDEGVDLTVKDYAGLTPMHRGIYASNREAIQVLLNSKCSRDGMNTVPYFEPAIEFLMTLDEELHNFVVDNKGHTGIDKAVQEFEDEDTQTIFGMLLGWPDER
ncbi:ankyrin repeat-containing domain protein [Aspergillus pseudoustus]|uniref:Ankyrin repeat-containing domain protein n=1 Tax=Aspergillus pseudoustus TaxID=1810923 RepID=A0ABR4JZK2_9EURO